MLEGSDYCTAAIVFPIFCGFFDCVTGYTKSLTMISVHVLHSSLSTRVTSYSWRSKRTSLALKSFGAEVWGLTKEVVQRNFCEHFMSIFDEVLLSESFVGEHLDTLKHISS